MTLQDPESQIHVPPSFVALYTDPRRQRLSIGKAELCQRYELCEDLAQALVDTAATQSHGGTVSDDAVLARCHAGLVQEGSGLSAVEAGWVTQRLAELLNWAQPELPAPAP
ncbi:MAG: hypothetical protein EOO29_22290 [Comamonadaceae bacterium]|nr:MAG: hypothetical protein EOO29_22290 [Comamonadaceae bacterium]